MLKLFDKIGYREKLMGSYSLLTIIIITVIYLLISFNQSQLTADNIQKRIDYYFRILKPSAEIINSDNFTDNFNFLFNVFEADEFVKFIRVLDINGNIIDEKIKSNQVINFSQSIPISDIIKVKIQTVKKNDSYYDLIFPVFKGELLNNHIQLGLDFSNLKSSLDYNRDYYVLIFIMALVFAIVMSFFLGNSLNKKIRKLVTYTERVSDGNLDINLEFRSGDDFSKLASAFNVMVQKLEDSHHKLHSYQVSLEDTISKQNKILFESEEKYRNLVEASPEVILIIQNGRIVFSNNQITKMFGIDIEDIMDQLVDEVEFLSKKDRNKLIFDLERILPNDPKVYMFEFLGFDRNKNEYILEFSVHRIQHNHNDAFQVIIRNVTKQKKNVNELLQLQKMESIGSLASSIAHDFNNILGVIIPNAEMIKKNSVASFAISRDARNIEYAALQASELTSKLLSFSRKADLKIETIHPNLLIENVIKLITRIIGKNIKITKKLNPKIKNIAVDINQIEQVLLNIVINAQGAMPDGGLLNFKTDIINTEQNLKENSTNIMSEPFLKIDISDTGSGMPENIQKRIFEPFFTTKKSGQGTGLGLSTSFSILQNHNGSIEVISKVNKGTTFSIILPFTDKKVIKKDETLITLKKGAGLVLLIEDEVMMLETAQNLLEHLGFDTITTTNGKTGVKLFKEKKTSIKFVIVDMEMPEMDGLETLAELQKIDPKVKVIISSGYSLEGKVKSALNNGAKTFLKKPYRLKELTQSINKVVQPKSDQLN